MTLGGMLKHLAYVGDWWFSRWLHGRDPAPMGHGGLGCRTGPDNGRPHEGPA